MQSWTVRYGWIDAQSLKGHECAGGVYYGSITEVTVMIEDRLVCGYDCLQGKVVVKSDQYVNDRLLLRSWRGKDAEGVEWFAEAELIDDSNESQRPV